MRQKLTYISAAIMLVMIGFVASAGLELTSDANAEKLWVDKSNNPAALSPDAPVRMNSFIKLAKSLSPAVVNITTKRRAGDLNHPLQQWGQGPGIRPRQQHRSNGMGSGFIIHPDGWILTNNHVIENSAQIQVKLNSGETYSAQVVGTDNRTDTALLKINAIKALVAAPLGDSNKMEIGAWAVAIGNPFGLNHTVTAGIVSAKGRRNIHPGNNRLTGVQMYENFIQTDASINPGNSGGPLINIRGEVIGINTAINAAGQGIGFAIPINMVKTLIPQLHTGTVRRSWIGVSIQPVTENVAQNAGLSSAKGALIGEVMSRSPASKAGLVAGDIILVFDGHSIKQSSALPWLASNAGIGRKVNVVVWRDGRKVSLSIVLGSLPGTAQENSPKQSGSLSPSSTSSVGMKVSAAHPGGGLRVETVEPQGPAEWAGIQAGDVIKKINYKRIKNLREFRREVDKVPSGKVISMVVKRNERTMFVAFTKP